MAAPSPGITARAHVARVIDGDTVEVELRWPVRIRMRDCYAPELTGSEKPAGEAAKQHLERILTSDQSVIVKIDSGHADNLADLMTFGRVLGSIYPHDSSLTAAQMMIAAGHATKEKPSQ